MLQANIRVIHAVDSDFHLMKAHIERIAEREGYKGKEAEHPRRDKQGALQLAKRIRLQPAIPFHDTPPPLRTAKSFAGMLTPSTL
ncbi:hypothetical protein D3C80_1970160 [compost metagenome]